MYIVIKVKQVLLSFFNNIKYKNNTVKEYAFISILNGSGIKGLFLKLDIFSITNIVY